MRNMLILLCMPEKCTTIEVFLGIFCGKGQCEVEAWAPFIEGGVLFVPNYARLGLGWKAA